MSRLTADLEREIQDHLVEVLLDEENTEVPFAAIMNELNLDGDDRDASVDVQCGSLEEAGYLTKDAGIVLQLLRGEASVTIMLNIQAMEG